MKRLLGICVVVGLALAMLGPPASAFTFEEGANLGKMMDWGSFFRPNAAGTSATPLPVGTFALDDWNQTLFNITELYEPPSGFPADKYYFGLNPELMGLMYDLKVGAINVLVPAPFLTVEIDLVAAGRYDSVYTGGRVDLWEDPANDFTADPTGGVPPIGPANWGYGAPGAAGWDDYPFDPGEYDTFPTATDGTATPLLSGTIVPYDPVNKPGVLITLTLSMWNGTGMSTQGFIYLTHNYSNVYFQQGYTPAGLPYHISFVNRFDFWPNQAILKYESRSEPFDNPNTAAVWWATHSQDPIRFTAYIPEPGSMSLLGLGLVGLAGLLRRRRK